MPNIKVKVILVILLLNILVIIGNSQQLSTPVANEIAFENALVTTSLSGYISAVGIPKNFPLKDATVLLYNKHNKVIATTKANQEGYFTFKNFRKGDYIITTVYELDGGLLYRPFSAPIKVRKNNKIKNREIAIVITLDSNWDVPDDGSKIELKSEDDAKAMLDNSLDPAK